MFLGLLHRYVLKSLFPYFLFSLCFLTVILAVQQITKISETLPDALDAFTSTIVITQVLLPKILMFTIPMSTLVGVILGLNRLKAESELRIIQGVGVGPLVILLPLIFVGAIIAIACGYNNLYLAPDTQRWFRQYAGSNVTTQQVGSSIVTGTFNSEIPNLTLYVRQGDSLRGEWTGIFLVKKETDGERVITASTGRLDVEGEEIELVLNDVYSLKYSPQLSNETPPLVVERFNTLRLEVEKQKVQAHGGDKGKEKIVFDELGTDELIALSRKAHTQSTEANIQLHRRLALAFSPIVLMIIGFTVVWFSSEGGKVWGLIVALFLLIAYYLLFLLGEQMSRSGLLPSSLGDWVANISMLILVPVTTYLRRRGTSLAGKIRELRYVLSYGKRNLLADQKPSLDEDAKKGSHSRYKVTSFPMLLDLNVISRLSLFFLISYLVFISLFFIFTIFELWKSIFTNHIAPSLIGKYLLHLLPYVSVQVFAPCAMIASLTVFLIMVNRSEIPVWLSTGISVYRILLPILCFSIFAVLMTWVVQDRIMPESNLIQDSLRFQIRTGYPKSIASSGRQWIALDNKIFNYEFNVEKQMLSNPLLYQLDQQGRIERLFIGLEGKWADGQLHFIEGNVIETRPSARFVRFSDSPVGSAFGPGYFSTTLNKPLYLNAKQLENQIGIMNVRGEDTTSLRLSLQKKYADALIPFVLAVLGACVGLLFGRGKPLRQILVAIFLGVSVIAVTQLFTSLGLSYRLPTSVIAWSPTVIFGSIALYLLALLKT